jgi:hypothetical protein
MVERKQFRRVPAQSASPTVIVKQTRMSAFESLRFLSILVGVIFCLTFSVWARADAGAELVAPEVLSLIKVAPENVQFGDSVLRLKAEVWRNLMPLLGASPDGRPMVASLVVVVDDGPPVALHVDAIWILQGDSIWQSHDVEEGATDARGATNEYVVRDGPKLKPGTYVDIVVKIADLKGNHYFLSARHQSVKFVS